MKRPWKALCGKDKDILGGKFPGCGQGTILGILRTLFYLVKAKDPSWEMTQEEFDQLNIGTSLSEKERQQLGDLLRRYCEVFTFNPNELGDSRITEHIIDTGDAPPVYVPGQRVSLVGRENI